MGFVVYNYQFSLNITGVNGMKDKFKVHIYKDGNLRKDDYAFEWEGDLEYELVHGYDPKTKEPVYNNQHIKITDWSNFEQALHEAKINNKVDKYNPIAFWRHDSEDSMFETGQTDIIKINCSATHIIHSNVTYKA